MKNAEWGLCYPTLGAMKTAPKMGHPALLLLASTPGSRLMRGLFIWAGLDRMHGNSADKTLIVSEAFAEDHHTLVRDFILANILGMIPTPHLDNHHDLAKLAIDGYVSQPDDVVGKERN